MIIKLVQQNHKTQESSMGISSIFYSRQSSRDRRSSKQSSYTPLYSNIIPDQSVDFKNSPFKHAFNKHQDLGWL